MRNAQTIRLYLLVLLALAYFLSPSRACAQQISSSWNGGTGNWGVATNWNPATVPNNGATSTYSVTIGASNSVVTMDVLNDTIDNLTLGAKNSLNISSSDGLRLASGDSFNNGRLTNFGAFVLVDSFAPTFTNNSGAYLINQGTMGWGAPSIVTNNAGGHVVNNGTIDFSSCAVCGALALLVNNGMFVNNGMIEGVYNDLINGAGAKFDSSGTIDQSGGPGFSNAGKFNNSGTITFNANNDPGSFSNSGTLNNSGTIAVGYSPFTFNIFSNSGTINNSGMLTVAFVNFDVGGDSFSNSGKISNSGTLTISGGGITVGPPSVAFENSGTINNSGTLNNTDASILDNSGIIKNTGTLNNTDGSSLKNGGTLNNIGTIFNDSTSTLINSGTLKNAGTINNSGTFMNSGAVTISNSGLLTTSTNYTQTAGSTRVNGTLTATAGAIVDIEGGSLSGTGIIGSNVLMGGTIMPGDAPGTLTIMGNYEQTSTGMFDELIGPGAHSFLDVSGNATLDPGSMLAITLLNGFDPLGQTFEIMDYAALFGQFANGSSFWDDNFRWDVTYGPNQIDVTAVQAPEPGMMSLVMIGLAGLTCSYWRKRPRSLRTRHDCA